MEMTHYMELLATNQPWNLLIFMAIPVILAEYIAISELYILFTHKEGRIKQLNRVAGIILGIYFFGVFLYLMKNAVLPLTMSGGWRGIGDIIAVGFYLLGVVPLGGIALLEMGLFKKQDSAHEKMKMHVFFVGMFLVVAHIAMIFGMLNPTVVGYSNPQTMQMQMQKK